MSAQKQLVIKQLVPNQQQPVKSASRAIFAPTNIALCKYWGKRDTELNLPVTSSLSITLPGKGSTTRLTPIEQATDLIQLNQQTIDNQQPFAQKIIQFVDLFRTNTGPRLKIETQSNIPIAAGLASSASGFAALVQAMDDLFEWHCDTKSLSILARLGSGSACRSLWSGFVEWHKGQDPTGMDSHGEPLTNTWPELCLGLCIFSAKEKPISSRVAMQRTLETSLLYRAWPQQVEHDLPLLKAAIGKKDFHLLGRTAEQNALAMHATMLASQPAICYAQAQTLTTMQQVWHLREQGLAIYFTQDAGPNLKLLFLQKDRATILQHFPELELVSITE